MVKRKLDRGQLLVFTANKYVAYVLHAARGLLVAKVLGPTLFGLWGVVTLIQQYLSYSHLGVHVAANVELSTKSKLGGSENDEILAPALAIVSLVGTLVAAAAIILAATTSIQVEGFELRGLIVLLAVQTVLNNYYQVALNVQRVHGNLVRISIAEFLASTIPLLVIPFFEGEMLVTALLAALIIASMVGILVMTVGTTFSWVHTYNLARMKQIFAVAFPLFVFMISTYLVLVGTRTIVGLFYDLQTLAYYTLANSLAAASTLGIHAIAWAINPIILHKFRAEVEGLELPTVLRVTAVYRAVVFLVTGGIVLLSPLLFVYLDRFTPARSILVLLLVGQMINSFGYGFNTLAIARKKLYEVTRQSLLSLSIVLVSALSVGAAGLASEWIAVCTIVGAIIFTTMQNTLGRSILAPDSARLSLTIRDNFRPQISVPILLLVVSGFASIPYLWSSLGLVGYIILNFGDVKRAWEYVHSKREVTSATAQQDSHQATERAGV